MTRAVTMWNFPEFHRYPGGDFGVVSGDILSGGGGVATAIKNNK